MECCKNKEKNGVSLVLSASERGFRLDVIKDVRATQMGIEWKAFN